MQYQGYPRQTDSSKYPFGQSHDRTRYPNCERKYDNMLQVFRKPRQLPCNVNEVGNFRDIYLPEPPPDYDTAISEISSTYRSAHTYRTYIEPIHDNYDYLSCDSGRENSCMSSTRTFLPDQPTRSVLHSLKFRILLVVASVCVILAGAGVSLHVSKVFEGSGKSSAIEDDPPIEQEIFECRKENVISVHGNAVYRCLFQNVTRESLKLIRLSKENQTIIELSGSTEKTHDNVALSSDDGNGKGLLVTVKIADAKCNNSGDYYLAVHLEETKVYFNFSLQITDSVQSVDIAKEENSRGYIPDETLRLTCKAVMGCSSHPIQLVKVVKGDTFLVSRGTLVDNYTTQNQYGFTKAESYDLILLDDSDGDKYRCQVQSSSEMESSTEYEVVIVDKNFCNGKDMSKIYRHHRRCDVWIICQTELNPVIRTCQRGLHYSMVNDQCVIPSDAGCDL